jgi:hypothetical protein
MRTMQLATGTVIDGKVVVEGDALAEGAWSRSSGATWMKKLTCRWELEAEILE